MTREEAIKYLSEELEKTKAVVALTERDFGVSESVWHTETAAFKLAIAALRAEEGVAKLSEFLQEKLGEQESGSCKNCTDHGNCSQKGNGWISVEERLPEVESSYLTYTDKGSIIIDSFCIYPEHGTKFWVGGNGRVTHWMPLPEAPKEDTHD